MKKLVYLAVTLLLGGCAAQTHVFTPWIDINKTLELDVDWIIRYYQPGISDPLLEMREAGYRTALILGNGLNSSDSYQYWLDLLATRIEETRTPRT